jgi:hypothetical protein
VKGGKRGAQHCAPLRGEQTIAARHHKSWRSERCYVLGANKKKIAVAV